MNNFLSIVWYRVLPAHYGGQKGIAHFNHFLGKKTALTCLCSRNNVPGDPISYKVLNDLPLSKLQFWNPVVRRRILLLIRQQRFSHVIIEHPWHGWLGKFKKKYGFTFIVHAHNIEHVRIKEKNKLWWPFLKRTEQKAFQYADHILLKTENDRQAAISAFHVATDKCLIVPYGTMETKLLVSPDIKMRIRKKHALSSGEKLILFAGSLDYPPNARSIEAIIAQVIPRLQNKKFCFRVIICGALPENKLADLNAMNNITATGFVDSIGDYMQAADVFINPVIYGAGIQTKNVEALANGCNVVTTAFAAAGLPRYLIYKKLFVSADGDWEHFTDNIITASAHTADVPPQFYQDYHWQHIIDRLLPQIDG